MQKITMVTVDVMGLNVVHQGGYVLVRHVTVKMGEVARKQQQNQFMHGVHGEYQLGTMQTVKRRGPNPAVKMRKIRGIKNFACGLSKHQ